MQAMLSSMRNALATARSRFANLNSPLRLLVLAAVFVFASLFLVWLVDKIFVYLLARSYVDEIAEVFALNNNLSTAFYWLLYASIHIFPRFLFLFSESRGRNA